MKLDDAIAKQNYTAAQQNLETIKTQLSYAQNIYQRQQNLWNQNIGTEVQLLSAKIMLQLAGSVKNCGREYKGSGSAA
ncbi:MAG: hypothetical protein WDM71_11300 [Ferruginibacter sp.]